MPLLSNRLRSAQRMLALQQPPPQVSQTSQGVPRQGHIPLRPRKKRLQFRPHHQSFLVLALAHRQSKSLSRNRPDGLGQNSHSGSLKSLQRQSLRCGLRPVHTRRQSLRPKEPRRRGPIAFCGSYAERTEKWAWPSPQHRQSGHPEHLYLMDRCHGQLRQTGNWLQNGQRIEPIM